MQGVEDFCGKIGLGKEVTVFILSYKMDGAEYLRRKQDLQNDRETFIKTMQERHDDGPAWFLVFCVHAGMELVPEYEKRGIDDSVYFDTFRDITIWQEHYFSRNRKPGLDEYSWLTKILLLRIFRLGRLQFEPVAFRLDVSVRERQIKAGELVLNVHIPEGEALDNDACNRSYERAPCFFRGINPVFTCNSWLLFPGLQDLLSPDSNIIRFQGRYHIYEVDMDSRQGEERIFGTALENKSLYPEMTSLQRKAKKYLMEGNKIGLGRGIFF